jgi:hypothetical protein
MIAHAQGIGLGIFERNINNIDKITQMRAILDWSQSIGMLGAARKSGHENRKAWMRFKPVRLGTSVTSFFA